MIALVQLVPPALLVLLGVDVWPPWPGTRCWSTLHRTDWCTGEAEVGRNDHSCAICVLQLFFKYDLVKYDMLMDQPVKDQRGFCQRVDKGRVHLQQNYCIFF